MTIHLQGSGNTIHIHKKHIKLHSPSTTHKMQVMQYELTNKGQ